MQKFQKNRGESMVPPQNGPRDRAFAMAMRRKEDFLGARVPKELKDRVIQRARELDLPVSLLIRKVLEDAFAVDGTKFPDISSNIVADKRTEVESDPFLSVFAWKAIELNQAYECDRCDASLKPGEHAAMGILKGDEGSVFVCNSCKEQIQGGV